MLYTEWNLDDALAVRYEEGREEGISLSHTEVLGLISQGLTIEEIKQRLEQKTGMVKTHTDE
jgi:ATP/maltotriose-dependent transcriptional regulator MalT